ncbi:TetR family transcriptional regulator [Nocardioides sp.]|uniref:TetR family transcriptional regulator n=1 Tax=Nocardioides sp. TaxID=35761 RepID=UPI00356943D5
MTATTRRPGPRSDVDVRLALVVAAERLFGSASVDGVSMRAVARAAGVAPAALTHYFPNKSALVYAVVQRRAEPVGRAVSERLIALADPERDPGVTDLVEAVLIPFVELLDAEPVAGLAWMKLFTSLALADDPIWARGVAGREHSVTELYTQALDRVLPHLDGTDRFQRVDIAMFSMLSVLACADLAGYRRPLTEDGLDPQFVRQLVIFTSAGLAAPN